MKPDTAMAKEYDAMAKDAVEYKREVRRFELAKAAMQGFCSNTELVKSFSNEPSDYDKQIADNCVCLADALLAALEEKPDV
jgi:hypothetical protein